MTEDRFAACPEQVLSHEGGYVDHPDDPGGATNMGITRRTLAAWRGIVPFAALPKSEVKALGRAEAAAIYRAEYWAKCRAGEMPAGLDLAVFDFAVNSGPARAVRTLQTLLGVAADGVAGPVTLGALRARTAAKGATGLIEALCDRRLRFLEGLSTFPVFGRGWRKRVAAIRTAARAAATRIPAPAPPVLQPDPWRFDMDFLSGYRTYIIAAAMIVAGLAQLLGVELPALDGRSAGQLVMEALALVFLRRGIKSELDKA